MKKNYACFLRRSGLVAVLGGLIMVAACSEAPKPEPVKTPTSHLGMWESIRRSGTGMGDAIELLANGSTRRFRAVMEDAHYQIRGDSLVVTPILPDSLTIDSARIPRIVMKFSVANDTLFKEQPPHSYWLERLSGERVPDAPVVGYWRVRRSTHNLTIHKFERYSEDGIVSVRQPGVMDSGFYDISGDSLHLQYLGKPEKYIHFEVSGDTLGISTFSTRRDSLTDSLIPTRLYRYIRVADESWYHVGAE